MNMKVDLNSVVVMGFNEADALSVDLIFYALVLVFAIGILESICKKILE